MSSSWVWWEKQRKKFSRSWKQCIVHDNSGHRSKQQNLKVRSPLARQNFCAKMTLLEFLAGDTATKNVRKSSKYLSLLCQYAEQYSEESVAGVSTEPKDKS